MEMDLGVVICLMMLIGASIVVNATTSSRLNSSNSTSASGTADHASQLIGREAAAQAQTTALFVFGDSLVDNGNNNFLNSIAKSNYYPYGVDSNTGPTGRFSNGNTFIDYLGTIHVL